MGQLDHGCRWKRYGVGGVIAGACVTGVQRGCKTVESVHVVDYVTHLDESPLLQSVQDVVGTPSGISILLVTIVLLGGWTLRLHRERNALREQTPKQIAPSSHLPAHRPSDASGFLVTKQASKDLSEERPRGRRVRTIIAEREETRRTKVTLVEEVDEYTHRPS